MEEEIEISEQQQELIDIIISIISELKICEYEEDILPFKEALQKIQSFKVEENDMELKHYVFFTKQLFLDDKGSLDLDTKKLIDILEKDIVESIFDSLIEGIESSSFADFLDKLVEIFTRIFFRKPQLRQHIKEYENKGINSYEVLFLIFSECKKCKVKSYFLENYDIYFSETYSMNITLDLILAINTYIQLCISSPKFENLSDFTSDEDSKDSTTDNSKDKANKIIEIEKNIYRHLTSYMCNSIFLYSQDLNDFVLMLYDFLTRDGTENFILNNKVDEPMKIYLNYIFYPLEKLFNDFTKESLKEFYLSLFQFVDIHKGEDICFIKRAIAIGESNLLSKEDIGLISMLCSNHKCIEKIEKLANEKAIQKSNFSQKELEAIQLQNGLSDQEILIFKQIIKEKESQKSEVGTAVKPNCENQKIKEEVNTINIQEIPNQKICKQEKEINLPKNDFKNKEKEEINCEQLLSMINSMKLEINSLNKKILNLENDNLNLKKDYLNLNQKISNLENDNLNLVKKIDRLNNIHESRYFKDVSKFYAKQIAKKKSC